LLKSLVNHLVVQFLSHQRIIHNLAVLSFYIYIIRLTKGAILHAVFVPDESCFPSIR
jgi:hypothetical protein